MPPRTPRKQRRSRGRWPLWGLALAGAVVVALLVALLIHRSRRRGLDAAMDTPAGAPGAPAAARAGASPGPGPTPLGLSRLPSSAGPLVAEAAAEEGEGGAPLELWQRRLARARTTLDRYLEATRFPPESRPITEKPDLYKPYRGLPRKAPLVQADGTEGAGSLFLSQDRYHLVGNDSVRFFVGCAEAGDADACTIVNAQARVVSDTLATRFPVVDVAFNDRGLQGDATAGDGLHTGLFTPGKQGFAGYHGNLLVDLRARVDGQLWPASFSIMLTPEAPAVFTGKVRDVMEDGSLSFYVEVEVKHGGRYLINARVDDDTGKSFAFLLFNDSLDPGRREVRLSLHGRLVHDLQPQSPFRLRDLDGFHLLEDVWPDRELMRELEGVVHTTARHEPSAFSDALWDSEEKRRNLAMYTEMVNEYTEMVDRLGETP